VRTLPTLPAVNAAEVLRAQGADPARLGARAGRLVALAEQALALARPLAEPGIAVTRHRVAACHADVVLLEGGHRLRQPAVAAALAGAEELVAAALTLGPALEARVRAYAETAPGLALALDAAGAALVQALAAETREELRVEGAARGLVAGTPFGPGMPGWPVHPGQRELLALLETPPAGLTVLESGMLTPAKSLTFLLGLGRGLSPGGEPCATCDQGGRCKQRPAG